MIMFRADGNEIIGSGHIMRCLSIAKAAEELGEESCFVLADRSFSTVVENAGVKIFYLDMDFKNMQEELEIFIPFLKKTGPRCVIVDSYYVTERYLEEVRKYTTVVYIDDLGSFAYPVDVVVNYNIYGERINYTQIYHKQNRTLPRLLLGPEYAPLRKEFEELKRKPQAEKVEDILISTGGSDHEHVALKLAQYIAEHEKNSSCKYHFLLGLMNPDILELTEIAEEYSALMELHQNVKQIVRLMLSCDIAVSAAGSTLYELCACGVPTVTYVLADNQILGAQAFSDKGLMLCAGDCRDNVSFADCVMQAVRKLSNDYLVREQMSKKMSKLISGNGAKNIVKAVLSICRSDTRAGVKENLST